MAYIVKSSEQTRSSGAEMETKALLYLMNFREDSKEIYYYIVDFFNDITGMDRQAEKLWDVQSKAGKDASPKKIGEELVTLFKNYLSDFEFEEFILFVGGVSKTVRKDDTLTVFGIDNIQDKARPKIIKGLKEEAEKKIYIDGTSVTDDDINEFLTHVKFVIDDKPSSEYVRAILKDSLSLIADDRILNAIFNEIRNTQSNKKNTKVEGVVIQTKAEALNHFRHIDVKQIRLLTLQRIINKNPIDGSIPRSFIPIYEKCPPESQNDLLQDCRIACAHALFNKSSADDFWRLLNSIYKLIIENPDADINVLYEKLDNDIKNAAEDFDEHSLKYFMAQLKDGIQRC